MNDDSNTSTEEGSWRCDNVSYQGRTGCLELCTASSMEEDADEDPKIRFDCTTTSKSTPSLQPASSSCCWGLSNIENHSIRAVSSTLTLELVNGGTVSFQMKALPDLVRFRKALVVRQRQLRQHQLRQQQKNHENQQQQISNSRPLSPPTLLKEEKKEEDQDDSAKHKKQKMMEKEEKDRTEHEEKRDLKKSLNNKDYKAQEEGVRIRQQQKYSGQQQQSSSSSLLSSASGNGYDDTNSASEEELQDDLVAREILRMTGAFCNQQQQQPQETSIEVEIQQQQGKQSADDAQAAADLRDRDLKEKLKAAGGASAGAPPPTTPTICDRDLKTQQKLASAGSPPAGQSRSTASTAKTTASVVRDTPRTKTMTPVNMQTATAVVVASADADETETEENDEEHPTELPDTSSRGRGSVSSSQRGPGAYRRMPGAQSTRASTDFSVLGGQVEAESSMIFRLSSEMDNLGASSLTEWSDEQQGGGDMRNITLSSSRRLFGPNPNHNKRRQRDPMVQASLVEEEAEVRYSTVMPSAVEVDISTQDFEQERKKMAMGFSGCCCIVMLIVTTIVASVTFVLVTKKSTAVAGTDPNKNNNNNVVMTSGNRMEAFQQLVAHVTMDPDSLEADTMNSPAYKACQWLAQDDPKQLDPTDTTQHDRILQRYILTLFYYQTSSSGSWRYCSPPDTGESIACRHKLLESYGYEGVYHNEYMHENAFRWLSEAEECWWAGIRCEDGKHVSSIQLGGYGLKGSFPVELVHLSHLKMLDLQLNRLHSTLPPEFGWLGTTTTDHQSSPINKQLETLRLDQNLFTGTIPEEWCSISEDSLESLILSGNQLTGSLPTCLGNLIHLKDFSVMSNRLTGTIPETLSDCANLERFHFAHNNFEGSIPPAICNAASLQELSSDCLDNDVLECSCCTKCCDPSSADSCELTTKNGGGS